MLSHGFVDDPRSDEFILDETDPMAYGVVRWHVSRPVAGFVVIVILALVAFAAAVIFA